MLFGNYPNNQTDQLAWISTSNEGFSVKSAYHLEKNRTKHATGESTTTSFYSSAWKMIWQLNVTGVMKVY